MRKNSRYLLFLLLWPLCSVAEQVKLAQDNKTISIKISAKELTRIYVEGDRIFQVRGSDRTYHLEKDEREGAIFIRPQPHQQTKPFSLFLTTEQGRTYPLLLIPLDVPSETVAIKPTSPSPLAARRWETSTSYANTVANLVTSMANGERPTGYAVTSIQRTKPTEAGSLSLQLKTHYVGARLKGEIIAVTNTSDSTQQLNPQQFYSKDVYAIALANEQLSPGSQTLLYRVMKHEN
jgi:type-F conjugative transfer system secretin TraK